MSRQGLKLQSQSRTLALKACRVPHRPVVEHVFNGRLTYITYERINFANEGSRMKDEKNEHEKGRKKKRKKKQKKKRREGGRKREEEGLRILLVVAHVCADRAPCFKRTCTRGTLVLGTCYSGRNTVRTSCQQQVPASLRVHAYIFSAGNRNRAKIQPLRHHRGPDVHTPLPESLHAFQSRHICSANSPIVRFSRLSVCVSA